MSRVRLLPSILQNPISAEVDLIVATAAGGCWPKLSSLQASPSHPALRIGRGRRRMKRGDSARATGNRYHPKRPARPAAALLQSGQTSVHCRECTPQPSGPQAFFFSLLIIDVRVGPPGLAHATLPVSQLRTCLYSPLRAHHVCRENHRSRERAGLGGS